MTGLVKRPSTHYFNRELSWLSFNYRVLLEAADERVPLYERIKFLAIYTANLEEFFRVRVAASHQLLKVKKAGTKNQANLEPIEILQAINEVVMRHHYELEHIFNAQILPELHANGIILYQQQPLAAEHQGEIANFFKSKVLSYLQPVFIRSARGSRLFLENDVSYMVVLLRNRQTPANESIKAYLNVPSQHLGRFIRLRSLAGKHYFIFLEDIIRRNLKTVFPGYEVDDCYLVKMDRNADLTIEDEYSGNLVEKVRLQLAKRQTGDPIRFIYEERMPAELLDFLIHTFKLRKEDAVPGGSYQNLDDLMKLPNPLAPQLQYAPLATIGIRELDRSDSLFECIRQKDWILHFPYHSYNYVLQFFNEAAIDPHVREIKVTLYRIASNSFIGNALITAAKNGKKVTVFVEVKARFDEANNLQWAEKMQQAGIHIIYSLPGLKVHAKIALVRRVTPEGRQQNLAYFGTGNFNERTAEIYTDHGLFTTHPGMVGELKAVFTHLAGTKIVGKFKHLLVAQFNMQQRFLALLDREIALAKQGKPAQVIIKLNNLEDTVMINKLYEASAAGVSVELLIRGICCLVPGVAGLSEHIRVTRLVDRFLEHARVFWFANNGKDELYLSSADWMKRNLYKRIEVGFPIYDPEIKKEVKQLLDIQLQDTVKARRLDETQQNLPIDSPPEGAIRAQMRTYDWLKEKQEMVQIK